MRISDWSSDVCSSDLASGGTAGTFFYITTPGFGAMTLTRHGTEEQKQEILPGLAAGRTQFCLALPEPDAGPNAIAFSTAARRPEERRAGKEWVSTCRPWRWR